MAQDKITAQLRSEFGKGAARRIRRAHQIPAVVYSQGEEPQHLTLPGHATMMALKHGGANALLDLDIDGSSQLALTKQVQIDPITRIIEHIDFVAVKRGEKVTVDVPVTVVGESAPETLVVTENATVSVEVAATKIPEAIEVSVEGAEVGTQIAAADLVLPAEAELLTEGDVLVVNVLPAPTAAEIEAELEEAEAEAGIERDLSDEEKEAQAEAEAEESGEGSDDVEAESDKDA